MENRHLGKPIFASMITMTLCFIIFDPSTALNYLGMILTGATVGWWVLSVYEGPTIISDRIINQDMWNLYGSKGVITLEDKDGDGEITLKDSQVKEE
tara:strand:- start:2622 stop:2912 length:291 start_codon:yes stop_codon:yes gene_type:complete